MRKSSVSNSAQSTDGRLPSQGRHATNNGDAARSHGDGAYRREPCTERIGNSLASRAGALEEFIVLQAEVIGRIPSRVLVGGCSGQLIPDTGLSFSSAMAVGSPPLN